MKRKRVVLDIPTKLQILDRLDNGKKYVEIAKEYGVGKSTVSDIKAAKSKLRDFVVSSEGVNAGRQTMKTSSDDQLDKALFTWFAQERHRTHCEGKGPLVPPAVTHRRTTLTANEGWLHRWKKRHGIRQLSIQGEILSSRHIDTEPFKEELAEWMIEHNIGPEQLYNADETGLYWKMMPNKTLASASENKAAGFKKVKDRVSILGCTNAAGTHKLPLLLIGKCQKPRCFKHVNLDRLPVTYRAQNNTWMTATIFQEWFKNVFVPK